MLRIFLRRHPLSIATPYNRITLSNAQLTKPTHPSSTTTLPPSSSPFTTTSTHPPPPLNAGTTEPSTDPDLAGTLDAIMSSMRGFSSDGAAARLRLDHCRHLPLSPAVVAEALSRLRNDWSAAFTFFLWASEQRGYAPSPHDYHSMISILARMRRFDTAWSLVREMNAAAPSLLTPQTLLILVRRYSAAHDVAGAIGTFHALRRFGFAPGVDDFHGLLGALCRYKNVEDAEHLLLCNERVFPFETKSFNIVLNGWCNAVNVLREAKRFWTSMEVKGIERDAVSYGCMISCYSKAGNLKEVLRLFHVMKGLGVEPDRKVYNAVVYALAKKRCVKEAREVIGRMEEKGVAPNSVTFNSLVVPLCKAGRVGEARKVVDEMRKRGLPPSVRTFHAFFRVFRTTAEVFEMLEVMRSFKCEPEIETYIMLVRKLCRWREFDKVYQLWEEISLNGPGPDRSMYIVLIHGLFLNGRMGDAVRCYEEMKKKGFSPEPKTDEMIQAWLSGKQAAARPSLTGLEGRSVPVGDKIEETGELEGLEVGGEPDKQERNFAIE